VRLDFIYSAGGKPTAFKPPMRTFVALRNPVITALFAGACFSAAAQTNQDFDGRPWHISTGNLSVIFTQSSPIGAVPRPNFIEAPPSVESQAHLKTLGLVANEDYVSWGAIEREPGQWNWQQHDAMEQTLHRAGLEYVVYDWVHFPPVWLRDQQTNNRTLMRCLEHGLECNYLSIFDPRTLQWYDHFYKNLRDHFGDKIDHVYACILGPYGEGNYPLREDSWVKMGHCHEGWWCGDNYGIKAFQNAMKRKYSAIWRLNQAWGGNYRSFDEVQPPAELADDKFKPSPEAFRLPTDKRRWLDFITWYHQAIIDFSEQSLRIVLKYYPARKVRMKPGGSAGGMNPLTFGTYCPGYAKMACSYGIVLQPADCQGAVFADKWMGTAYQFYGVKECTEPAGGLDEKTFVRRMFSDASAGAAQFFTYEFENHATNMQKYIHLYAGRPGETEIAVYCPTTLYRLGGDVRPTIASAAALRDLCEFDVLDELLISDGALTTRRCKYLIVFQGEIIDAPILKKMDAFLRTGGKIIEVGNAAIKNVEGAGWTGNARVVRVGSGPKNTNWRKELAARIAGCKGVDGQWDGLWTCRRGTEVFVYNSTGKTMETEIDGLTVSLAPDSIWFNQPGNSK
jgi:hypothetical protein